MCPIYSIQDPPPRPTPTGTPTRLDHRFGWKRHVGGGPGCPYACISGGTGAIRRALWDTSPPRGHISRRLWIGRELSRWAGRLGSSLGSHPSRIGIHVGKKAQGEPTSSKLFAACTIITCRCLHWVAFALIWADIMVLSVTDRVHARLGILLAGSPHLQHCTDKHGYRLLVSRRLN